MSYVHRVLGKERIKEICEERNLTSEDQKIIDTILEKWERLLERPFRKIDVAMETIGNNPRHIEIANVIYDIIMEFSSIELEKRLNAENN